MDLNSRKGNLSFLQIARQATEIQRHRQALKRQDEIEVFGSENNEGILTSEGNNSFQTVSESVSMKETFIGDFQPAQAENDQKKISFVDSEKRKLEPKLKKSTLIKQPRLKTEESRNRRVMFDVISEVGQDNLIYQDSSTESADSADSTKMYALTRMNRYMNFNNNNYCYEKIEQKVSPTASKSSPKTKRKKLSISDRRASVKVALKQKFQKISEERMTVRQIFTRFVKESTLHGFVYVFSETFLIRKIIWAILMILGAIYFIIKLKEGIQEYFEFPFSTLSTIKYVGFLNFPAISICPINNLKHAHLRNKQNFSKLFEQNRYPLHDNWSDPGFDITGENLRNHLKKSSVKIHDILKSCEWIAADTYNGGPKNPCGAQNFTSHFNEDGKLCFTINQDQQKPLVVNRSGLNFGLSFLFDLKVIELLNLEEYNGLEVTVHNPAVPLFRNHGFSIATGFHTFVDLKAVETHNLPPPFSTECGEKQLKYFDTYNQKRCSLELLTDYVGERCHCREPFMPDNGLPYCSLRQTILCSLPVKASLNDYEMHDRCPVDCEIESYETDLSYSRFLHNPPKGIDERIEMQKAGDEGLETTYLLSLSKSKKSTKELDDYIKHNLISIIFYFGAMEKYRYEQEATFDFYQFLGDMGGEIGLMLGASLLTFVEFVDLVIYLIYHQLLRLYTGGKREH